MLEKLKSWLIKKPEKPKKSLKKKVKKLFEAEDPTIALERINARTFQRTSEADTKHLPRIAQDANIQEVKRQFAIGSQTVSIAQLDWFSSQGFIGPQTCALLSQHWLIDKACSIGARDAVRNGYEVTVNKDLNIPIEVLDEIREQDKKYNLNANLVQLARMSRIFGIRIAIFKIESDDPEFYQKPFNLDGVLPGSYKGISQVDPYWITPELDAESAGDPASINFYEPTYWRVNGIRYHRTHLIILRTSEVPDILKPTYFYGGVPLPQKIFFRVFCAEQTANEAPHLALTKRATALHVDLSKALTDQAKFEEHLLQWTQMLSNFGVKILDLEEKLEQYDTSLADLDALIMTQYQLVAAESNVPAVKLLGTSPKGFNATGEHEEANYHEELRSIQINEMQPLLERHHLLLIKSEIAPKFNIAEFPTAVVWNPLDTFTAKELAELNKMKGETDSVLSAAGAIDGVDIRNRLINDPTSGYNGIEEREVEESSEGSFNDEPGDEFDSSENNSEFYNAKNTPNEKTS